LNENRPPTPTELQRGVKLTRFRGLPPTWGMMGGHDAEDTLPVSVGVSGTDH
jgi:hypothetical protein